MHTIHLVSHTHWDREWHETFQQFRLKLVHLVDGLLHILATDEQYRFFMLDGQTIVLEDYLHMRPEKEAILKGYIQQGRILIGPWYILPDEFLVSPEATIRNLLEGDRTARGFGAKMEIGYLPDTFGHIGQMPQILDGFGLKTACIWRGVGDQSNEFWWAAPDGSRVLMGFLQQGYFNAAGILNNGLDDFVADVIRLRDQLAKHTTGKDLVLMHGIDHQEAHPDTSKAVAHAQGKLDGDELLHSTLPAYFEQIQKHMDLSTLPVVTGEFRLPKNSAILPGVLSARIWIKQRNQASETLLEKWAEPFAAWAQAFAREQFPGAGILEPQDILRQAWRLLMQCHPHDSICGCSIDQVHTEMRPRFDQVDQIAETITAQSLTALSNVINTSPPANLPTDTIASAVVIFNPHGISCTGPVTVELKNLPESGEFDIVNELGQPVPFQQMGTRSGMLFNLRMDRDAFKSTAGALTPGSSPGGMRVIGMEVVHDPAIPPEQKTAQSREEVLIKVHISPVAEIDLEAWDRSRQEITALLDDPAVKTFHIELLSDPASQVQIAAPEVPPLGYRTFWVQSRPQVAQEPAEVPPLARILMPIATRFAANPKFQSLMQRLVPDKSTRPPFRIENEFFTVEAQHDGSMDIFDKSNQTLFRGQNRFMDGGDRGDTYNYSPPESDQVFSPRVKSIRTNRQEILQELEIQLELEIPAHLSTDRKSRSSDMVTIPITTRVRLYAGTQRVEFHTSIDNLAQDHRLRVHFAAPFKVDEAEYDGHFEIVKRPIHLPAFDEKWSEQPRPEVPQRAFTLVSNKSTGLLVANQGLPEVEVLNRSQEDCEIALTLLRCVGWLSRGDIPERNGPAGPEHATPGAQMPGHWEFDYAVIPFIESQRLQAIHQAYAYQSPMRGMSTILQQGKLPARGSFIQAEPMEFIASAVKTTEDRSGWLLRGYNISQEPITVKLRTLLSVQQVHRIDLAEEPVQPLDLDAQHEVTLTVKPFEVASVSFEHL